ncbi:hypothetical protein LOK49_Contig296G00001, partial [Camellia lanceoleosa]
CWKAAFWRAAACVLELTKIEPIFQFFPGQSAFDIQQADLKHQVKLGCCTVDILKQLSGEEISRNPSGGSKQRMNRLANHLLSQRRHVFLILLMEISVLDIKED